MVRFTERFERFLIHQLLIDDSVCKQLVNHLKPVYFEESVYRQKIVALIRDYFHEKGKSPSIDYLADLIENLDEFISKGCIEELAEIDSAANTYTPEEFRKLTSEFIKNKRMQEALSASIDDLEQSNLPAIKERIDRAYEYVGTEDRLDGLDYFNVSQRRMLLMEQPVRIPTLWPTLNYIMRGGLGAGEVGLVMAPAKIGKTQTLLHIAKAALIARKPTIYFSFEVDERILAARHDCLLTNLPLEDTLELTDVVEVRLRRVYGLLKTSLIFKQYPMRTAVVDDLREYVSQWEQRNQRQIELVIIDYPDIMRLPAPTSKNQLPTTELYTQIRRWAVEKQIPIWVASQITREGAKKLLAKSTDVAEDWQKIAISDIALTINMCEEEYSQNLFRLYVAGGRNVRRMFVTIPMRIIQPGYIFKEEVSD